MHTLNTIYTALYTTTLQVTSSALSKTHNPDNQQIHYHTIKGYYFHSLQYHHCSLQPYSDSIALHLDSVDSSEWKWNTPQMHVTTSL